MGKTRLAAEIAGEAHREDAAVFYAAGTGPPEAALAAIARTREPRRPALVVVDDADRAPAEVRAALRDLAPALHRLPVLVLATGQETAALARLEPDEALVLEPLDAAGVGAIAAFYAPAGAEAVPVETLLATSRGDRTRVFTRPPPSGRDARPHAASTRRPAARRPAAARRARSRRSSPAASSSCSRLASAPAWSAPTATSPSRRRSARTRAWRRSTPPTPSTSSGASGSSPSWSRASSAHRCSRSSDRRAAASRRSCGPGCCPPSRAASCPAATAGRRR